MADVTVEPKAFSRLLLAYGLDDAQAREVCREFSKNNHMMDDDTLVLKLYGFGMPIFQIIALFRKIGLSSENAIRILERSQKKNLGVLADSLEVVS